MIFDGRLSDWYIISSPMSLQLRRANNILSAREQLTYGVSQGSILGPFPYLRFFYDLPLPFTDTAVVYLQMMY